jgi:putative ABC transport system substrate-binding protein
MRRRNLLGFAAAIVAAPLELLAQPVGKVYRVGFLGISVPTPEILKISLEPFRQGLRERGWIEGKNIVVEQRWAEGKSERFAELRAELVRLKVDVIVTVTSEAALAIRKSTQSTPIVGTFLGDPIKRGLIESYTRPGKNVTGLTSEAGGLNLDAKALEFLKLAVPASSRVAVLFNPRSAFGPGLLREVESAAKSLRIALRPVEAASPEQLEDSFAEMRKDGVDALLVIGDSMLFTHRERVAELAIRNRLAAGAVMPQFAQAGGLIGYIADFSDNYRRVAGYVDLILKGANPAELPVEQPTKFQLTVNVKTANALGLKLPYVLLLRADRVIE